MSGGINSLQFSSTRLYFANELSSPNEICANVRIDLVVETKKRKAHDFMWFVRISQTNC